MRYKVTVDTSHYPKDVPFEVPEGWCWCKMMDVCHIAGRIGFRGYTKADLVPLDGAITLSPSNIVEGKTDFSHCTYISWSKYEESPEIMVFPGDILLVKTGSSYGKVALVDSLPQPATINPQFVVLKHIKIDRFYLTYLLQSEYARKKYEEFVIGTAIPTFTQEALNNMRIPLPPYAEQRRIVIEVEKWFDTVQTITNGEHSLAKGIESCKSKILDLAIHGKLVPQDPSDEPAIELLKRINPDFKPSDNLHYTDFIPTGWAEFPLKAVCDILDSQREPINSKERAKRLEIAKTLYPYFGATGQVGLIDNYILDGEYLLLGEDGAPFLDHFAMKAYTVSGKIWVNNHAHVLKPKIDLTYMMYFLNAINYRPYVTGTTRLKLTQETMRDIPILVPPLAEQKRIASKIEQLFHVIDGIRDMLKDGE